MGDQYSLALKGAIRTPKSRALKLNQVPTGEQGKDLHHKILNGPYSYWAKSLEWKIPTKPIVQLIPNSKAG